MRNRNFHKLLLPNKGDTTTDRSNITPPIPQHTYLGTCEIQSASTRLLIDLANINTSSKIRASRHQLFARSSAFCEAILKGERKMCYGKSQRGPFGDIFPLRRPSAVTPQPTVFSTKIPIGTNSQARQRHSLQVVTKENITLRPRKRFSRRLMHSP